MGLDELGERVSSAIKTMYNINNDKIMEVENLSDSKTIVESLLNRKINKNRSCLNKNTKKKR